LSEQERQLLLSANVGEGLFFAGQSHVAIKVLAAPFEHNIITSNPQETSNQPPPNLGQLNPATENFQVTDK
jgi:conjugal transfer ATP-binding protein TraC